MGKSRKSKSVRARITIYDHLRQNSLEFVSALTSEPLGFTTKASPSSRVDAILGKFCTFKGNAIEETALVFENERLNNNATLASSGIRGDAQIGVLTVQPPSYTCPSCGAVTSLQEMRDDLDDIREYIRECADKLGYSSEPGYDYEKEGAPPPPATLSSTEVLEWWCEENYKEYGTMLPPYKDYEDPGCPKCPPGEFGT